MVFLFFFSPLLVIVLCAASAGLTPGGSAGFQRLQAEESFAACLRERRKKKRNHLHCNPRLVSAVKCLLSGRCFIMIVMNSCTIKKKKRKKKMRGRLRAGRPGDVSSAPDRNAVLSSPQLAFSLPFFPSSPSLPRHTLPGAGRLCF